MKAPKRIPLTTLLIMFLGMQAFAQTIQLRSTDHAECIKSDYTSLNAHFSFSSIAAQQVNTERGFFSVLTAPNTVIGGNEGDPQIPVVHELIAVPFGAKPTITVTSYSSTDYKLGELGIDRLMPRQPSVRKDQKPEDVPFLYNESAYKSSGLRSNPLAVIKVVGTMRGIQLGKMTIEPVSYDPVSNTLRVFNDIEVEVRFDGADAKATEQMLVDTYSPYFDLVYKQLFNGRAILDAYSDHPDLYTTPVKMLVVTTSTYTSSTAFQNWLAWKKQKGIEVDVQTVTSSTSSSNVRSLIQSRYNANHPTFLVIVGDETAVKNYTTWSDNSLNYSPYISDNGYASIDNDVYHDMFMSRMSVSTTTELNNLVNKILMYEKYTMPDPSYLDETLLIAGWDSYWTDIVGKPTIQYANNNYFNSSHGITPRVFITTATNQRTCYNYINQVGFVNYTAHGDIQMLADPSFTNSNISSMTNTNKYFWAMGNCCLTANWGNSSYAPCFGEALIRAANKGAFGYIGSIPESYWWEDYYFGVGAFNASYSGTTPSVSGTTKGAYDALFDETSFNTLNAVPYIGNVAVTYAHAHNYTSSVSDEYYWRGYQCLGDGSVMPYVKVPAANTVSHAEQIMLGTTSFTVNADAGSYVAITVNNEIIGVAQVPASGTVNVPITAQNEPGTAMIVVTRNQRQPYITSIDIIAGSQHNITCVQPEHGTISAPEQAYSHTTVTLTATPETGYCFDGWTVTDADGNTIDVTNNQFTMPESDITVTATFIKGFTVTLASVMYGTINADPTCALARTTINLTATPAVGYELDHWVVYKADDVNTTVNVNGNSFTMPDYDVCVTGIFSTPQGGEITIGSGSNVSSSLPTNVWYSYTTSQQLYTNEEFGSSGIITSISFNYNGNATSGARNLDIYMTHTTSTTLSSWVAVSESNKVYSGTQTFTSTGWYTFTLSTPFEYDGTSNVIITVDDNTGSNTGSSGRAFYTYSTGATRALYNQSDTNNVTPQNPQSGSGYTATTSTSNNQIKINKEVPVLEGFLSVSPSSLTGFEVLCGTEASDAQSIAVIGSHLQSDLTITAPSGFEVCATQDGSYAGTLTLTPDDGSLSTMVFVHLSAMVDPGDHQGILSLASGTTTATVSLSGNAIFNPDLFGIITATADPIQGGTVTGAGIYEIGTVCTLTATPAADYQFVSWEEDGMTIGTDPTLSFTVEANRALTAHFVQTIHQTQPFNGGWGWVSFYVNLSGSEGLQLLEEALGSNGVLIKSAGQALAYGNNGWEGSLESIEVEKMYQIKTAGNGSFAITAIPVAPEDHPIDIQAGWNWIGYPSTSEIDLAVAMSGFNPSDNDVIKSQNAMSTYIEGYGWWGTLGKMTPGKGYMYQYTGTGNKTLVYAQASRGQQVHTPDLSHLHWAACPEDVSSNATLVVTLDAATLPASDRIEIGAFVNGECRGTTKMMYVEPLNQYLAFMTLQGNESETIGFRVYQDGETYQVEEQVQFADNMVVGKVRAPFVLHVQGKLIVK